MTYQAKKAGLKEVEQLVHEQAVYQYLQENNEGGQMDKDQMLFLHEAISGSDLTDVAAYRVVSATLYMILAHDTHEKIDEPGDIVQLTRKEQELTVLAGDFYSALYYQTLAELEMIPLLRALQSGVQETNTAKTNIYQLHVATDEEYLTQLTLTNAAIFAKFAKYFMNDETFISLGCQFFLLKRLQMERDLYKEIGASRLKRAFDHGYFAKNAVSNFENWLMEIISDVKREVERLKEKAEPLSNILEKRIVEVLND
ncbi:heptaprenyl diphosphate synthase component 1 [Listeria ivanovii]|uniref:Putative heptaprenyl diphosphate synthase component I n=1 Tax=Listeria ivanovii (strain ATCC BAA-678 / PAM 55) TaxID=881621 RepID=G2ZCL9_LISIP|nr:heptaprenyl diphosphate synthase component 1 [Listeria ivanovii]AHI56445.1 heptaprenyl diphosphate synthase subunit I [Listeria ivanovii WSLC3009]AIS65868.1 heptaprenyl diphosphate synthase [Listeria ivanovii subsp. ivanovii]MBC1759096.1 heptaprenyl diphosphate synthase component 1 [Listeria ivanovii]MBK3914120.1 heptaprenyl diphosphate synthase component 1 [Listeria ivanovii subsp. ivanovii]MBK3921042.1 heptaprenyl diphosphate synthase component 1 [Listeria ivanovii subsp. ivanovii]